MIKTLIVIDSAKLKTTVGLLQKPPFSYPAEIAKEIFVPAGSPSGDKPATKHWLSGEISEEHLAACESLCKNFSWAKYWTYDLESQPSFPYDKLIALGLQPLKSEI